MAGGPSLGLMVYGFEREKGVDEWEGGEEVSGQMMSGGDR